MNNAGDSDGIVLLILGRGTMSNHPEPYTGMWICNQEPGSYLIQPHNFAANR